jgi:dephospho-CoA kinase
MTAPTDPLPGSDRTGDPSSDSKTRVLGVLGGIASGKSTVAKLLIGDSGLLIAADALAHAVLEDPEVISQIRATFGSEVLNEDGSVDRQALGACVFADGTKRRQLESWIHPPVRANIWADLRRARAAGVPVVVLDVPLLLENDAQHNLVPECDCLVFVEVSAEERERRARRDRGWAAGEVARREAAQLPLAEKRAAADEIVDGNGDLAELEQDVRSLMHRLGIAEPPPA